MHICCWKNWKNSMRICARGSYSYLKQICIASFPILSQPVGQRPILPMSGEKNESDMNNYPTHFIREIWWTLGKTYDMPLPRLMSRVRIPSPAPSAFRQSAQTPPRLPTSSKTVAQSHVAAHFIRFNCRKRPSILTIERQHYDSCVTTPLQLREECIGAIDSV